MLTKRRIELSGFARIGLLAFVAVIFLAGHSSPAWAISTLHVGTGVGTPCAIGCGGDPTIINGKSFSLYFNPNPSSSQGPIGDPFYLVVAVPVYSGAKSTDANIGSTAQFYHPFPTLSGTVIIDNKQFRGTLTSGDIYEFIGLGDTVNNSFNFNNMVGCLTGSNQCGNDKLADNALIPGKTITGFNIYTFDINTELFSPGDLLQFTSSLPIGTYVAAVGVDAGGTRYSVPFTESGVVPEPDTLVMLGLGLLLTGMVLAFQRS